MSEIIPHVYLSSVVYAKDQDWLNKNQIQNILIIGDLPEYFPSKFSYKCISIEDKPDTNISQYFEECIDYIDSIIAQDKNILVHCYGGQSRSVTIITAYIIRKLRLNSQRALNYVKYSEQIKELQFFFFKEQQYLQYHINQFSKMLNRLIID